MTLKGGQYEPRIRKRKVRARQNVDSKAEDRIEGINGQQVTGKKAKRLAKYLENKSKKDENARLKEQLAKNVIDSSVFVSSKHLGQRNMTKKQRMRQALEEERQGIAGSEAKSLLYEDPGHKSLRGGQVTRTYRSEPFPKQPEDVRPTASLPEPVTTGVKYPVEVSAQNEGNGQDLTSIASEEDNSVDPSKTQLAREESKVPGASTPLLEPLATGTGVGLKRPFNFDDDGRPILQKRQKRGGVKSKFSIHQVIPYADVAMGLHDDASWDGFEDDTCEHSELVDKDDKELPKAIAGCLQNENEASDVDNEASEICSEDSKGESGPSEGESDDAETENESDDSSSSEVFGDEHTSLEATRRERSSAFKEWAIQSRNEVLGFVPTNGPVQLEIPNIEGFQLRPVDQEPLPQELQPTKNVTRKAFAVYVDRPPAIQESRLRLPVVAEEQRIMEAIHNHDVVAICGTTGSGKTTQIPQFLFEAGYGSPESPTPGMIGITQPRRVAAVSMSKRVTEELGDKGSIVAYQIRFESNVSENTAMKFMTDGVLLREMSQDPMLRKYSAIILDEAHERSLNTDILLGLLSELVRYRSKPKHLLPPLKLIIMSATLRISDLTENPRLFKTPPPVIEVEGKQFPVVIHFSGVTRHLYVEEAFRKIKRGHRQLPPGGMLVFLTSQNEIYQLQRMLKKEFSTTSLTSRPTATALSGAEFGLEAEDIDFGAASNFPEEDGKEQDDYDESENSDEEKEFDIGLEEGQEAGPGPLNMHVLPLYAMLPVKEQSKVFQPPPPHSRLVVLATNIAETSLTIPGIRYVFDCGRAKERSLNKQSNVQSFNVGWISKASAAQRAGRAGRTGPGHCYRLYSSAVYERDFAEFAEPEILRTPIEGVVLELKTRGRTNVEKFPFPTCPDINAIARAEQLLSCLLAIDAEGKATAMGETMSMFPLTPRIARILIAGNYEGCLPYIIAIAAGLSVSGEVFISENKIAPQSTAPEGVNSDSEDSDNQATKLHEDPTDKSKREVRHAYGQAFSKLTQFGQTDLMMLMHVVMEFSYDPTPQWCAKHFVHYKTMTEARQLRQQLTHLLAQTVPELKGLQWRDRIQPPNQKQLRLIPQMAAAGFVDQVAIRADRHPFPPDVRTGSRAMDVPYVPLRPLQPAYTLVTDDIEKCVYIHPLSPMSRVARSECPEYIIYRQLQRAGNQSSAVSSSSIVKTRMLPLTDISGRLLAAVAKDTPLLQWGKPIDIVSDDGTTREAYIAPEMKIPGIPGQGWPLPARKVRQRRVPGKGWCVVTGVEECVSATQT